MGSGFIPTGIATGIAGSILAKEVVQAIAAGARFVLPAGDFYVYAVGADVRLQILDSTGVWNNLTAAGVGPGALVTADGVGLALFNAGGRAGNLTYKKFAATPAAHTT